MQTTNSLASEHTGFVCIDTCNNYVLSPSSSDPQSGSYSTKAWLERVLVVEVTIATSSVTMTAGSV